MPTPMTRSDDVVTLARLGNILTGRAEPGLPLPLYRVLSLIARGDARATRIARKLAIGKPSITAAVEALVERGLVVGSEVADDKRGVHLTVTSDGRQALDEAAAHLGVVLADVVDRCADPALVREALRQLGVALDDRAAERDRTHPL